MILAELRHPALAPSPYVARRATKYNELLKDGRLLRVASSGEDRTDEHVVQGVQEVRALQGASRPHAQLKTLPKMSRPKVPHGDERRREVAARRRWRRH